MQDKLLAEVVSGTGGGKLINPRDRKALREKISDLEAAMLQENTGLEVPLRHTFSPGVYAREIFIPAGTLIVGKIHKFLNMNMISQGDVSFFSIDGALRVKAPHTFVASPGVKRVIYAHEDTTWTTIHGTSETDLAKIEEEFIAKEYDEVYEATDRTLASVISVLGLNEELLTALSENELTQMPFPSDDDWLSYGIELKDSEIHGKGIFATRDVKCGAFIAPARIGGKRTPVGRYCNHSGAPNAKMLLDDLGDVAMIATAPIVKGQEILTDYYFNYTTTGG